MKILRTIVVFFFISSGMFAQLPDGFVYISDEIPTILIELRYFSNNNFIGKRIDGYKKNVGILSKEAVSKLKKVQNELESEGLALKIYDAYRPQRSVNHFWKWALNVNDTLMKQQYYPKVKKSSLFEKGYIASKSGHSRGSTIDITLVDLKTGKELDMGSPYDFFGSESWVYYNDISEKQHKNRTILQELMLQNGFKNYKQEWWHFTLKDEPFPTTYFDFEVK